MVRPLLIACCACWCVCVPLGAAPPIAAEKPSPMDEAFEWFDGLGFPGLKGCKLVRAATGEWSRTGSDPPQNRRIIAFLLQDDDPNFSVFTTDLFTRTFTRTAASEPEHSQVRYEPLDLAVEAVALLESLRVPRDDEERWRRFGERVSEPAEVFVIARACAANGLNKVAGELYEQAASMADRRTGKPPEDFRKRLSDDIAHAMMWRAVEAFGDPSVSREALLETFRRFTKNYPESEHAKRAGETAAVLEKMVGEDREHARQAAPETMTVKQRVAELIFQLRDQNGRQLDQPGACDIFFDPRGEKSPAGQLVAMGYEAVPQLIEALGDERFTRSVGFHRNFYFSHYVLRVGDCAERIIRRIAGRHFYVRRSTGGAMVKDEQVQTTRQEIEAWWGELQKKGEKQMLVEATARGDDNSPDQGRMLVEKYPDAALEALADGVRRAERSWVRSNLVRMVGRIDGDGPVPVLTEVLERDSSYGCRVAAAEALHRRGRAEAVRSIIELWNRPAPRGKSPAWEARDDQNPEVLVRFLVSCGSVDAIRALGKDLAGRLADLKLAVVSAMGESRNMVVFGMGEGSGGIEPANADPQAEAVRLAMEELLVRELEDTDCREGMSGSWGAWSFSDPRVCDAAGYVLSQRWPEKYRFDGNRSRTERDRQRIELINLRRKERGEPLLPMPQPVVIAPADPGVVGPMIKAVVEAKDEAERARAAEAIEALGLPALQAVREQAADADHPASAALERLARRLASVVREVVLEKDSLAPPASLQKALDAVKGRPLTSEGFVGIVLAGLKDLPAEAKGLRVTADRSEEPAGVVITVGLARKTDSRGRSGNMSTRAYVSAGSRALLSSSGSSSLDYVVTAEKYKDFVKAANQALSSPAGQPLEMRLTLMLEE